MLFRFSFLFLKIGWNFPFGSYFIVKIVPYMAKLIRRFNFAVEPFLKCFAWI